MDISWQYVTMMFYAALNSIEWMETVNLILGNGSPIMVIQSIFDINTKNVAFLSNYNGILTHFT